MKKAALTSAAGGTFVVRDLQTGKILATRSSASKIRRLVGVRPSEAKVAAKALEIVVKSPEAKASKTAKVSAAKPPRSSQTSRRSAKTS